MVITATTYFREISRHFANAPCFDVIFRFAQNVIEFSLRDVALHLLAWHAVALCQCGSGRRRVALVLFQFAIGRTRRGEPCNHAAS